MTAPALAARRFLLALAVGAGLGVVYGFLRPPRRRFTQIFDGIFVLVTLWAWVYLSFGLCKGELRFGYTMGMLLGAVLWEMTAGHLLRPVFAGFWKFLGYFWLPFEKLFTIFKVFLKKLFAKYKIWVTMDRIITRRRRGSRTGGAYHGKTQKDPGRIPKDKSHGESADPDHRTAVHHRPDHPLRLH
jgi:hypothetical protein